MLCKEKWKRALIAIGAVLSVTAALSPATAGAAPGYPDLRTLPPEDIHLETTHVRGENHYVVRFTNTVWNAGEGPFELHGTPHFPPDGLFDAAQWIYDNDGGAPLMKQVGTFAYHASHSHFHFDGFARYELWKRRDYDRAAPSFTTGRPLFTSPKVSFCVMDITHVEPSMGPSDQVYATCTPALEGLSRGWGDVYDWWLADQWVDVGQKPLPDGNYVIRSIADADNIVHESTDKADTGRESQVANSAATYISIVNGRLAQGS